MRLPRISTDGGQVNMLRCLFARRRAHLSGAWAALALLLSLPADAGTFAEVLAHAWASQQPASQARQQQRQAQLDAAQTWFPEPPALTVSHRNDRQDRNQGLQEWEVELSTPLWLWGQRERASELAQRELAQSAQDVTLARWQLAGALREAWWEARLAAQDANAAQRRRDSARQQEADVALRVQAGELARLALNQASSARMQAEADWLRARSQQHHSLAQYLGLSRGAALPDRAETPADPASAPDPHPLLASLSARLASARARVLQADHDPRNAPELALTITRERSHRTEPYQTLGKVALKIPFGDRVRNAPRISQAHADWLAVQTELEAARQQQVLSVQAAHEALLLSQQVARQLDEAWQLARQRQGWVEQAVQAGQLGLPEQMRAHAESDQARAQAERGQDELGRAISRYHQSLGVLP